MKKMAYQNVKGTQDYLPAAELIRRDIRRKLEDTFIQYGCLPLETPILNYTELLTSKYGGGAEIVQEMYTLRDRGERDLALRYDLTIPFAKVVAMNPGLRKPFKRYEIGKVFRDGPIKTGRLREFTQCDVDIVGVASQVAEAELMIMALDAFDKLGLEVVIQFNNRKLLSGVLKAFGVPDDEVGPVVLILDKLEKVGESQVMKELSALALSADTLLEVRAFLENRDGLDIGWFESFVDGRTEIQEGLQELRELNRYLTFAGVRDRCVFTPFLARGLEIYTGTIYEIFLADQGALRSSIGSGGRYDNAIGGLIGSEETFSTVGISFGLDVIYMAMSQMQSVQNEADPVVDIVIIPLGTEQESLLLARKLRKDGYRVELDMSGKKPGKALERANQQGIPYAVVVGDDEVQRGVYKVKEMRTGEEREERFRFRKED